MSEALFNRVEIRNADWNPDAPPNQFPFHVVGMMPFGGSVILAKCELWAVAERLAEFWRRQLVEP